MSLMTDDDAGLNPLPRVLSPDPTYCPSLSGNDSTVNPARAYLLSLNSPRSRQSMASFLGIVATMFGTGSTDTCSYITSWVLPRCCATPVGPQQLSIPTYQLSR